MPYFGMALVQVPPDLCMVAAQHGAGKTRTIQAIQSSHHSYRCTEVTAVATPPQLSLIGTLIRYISQVETQGEGR